MPPPAGWRPASRAASSAPCAAPSSASRRFPLDRPAWRNRSAAGSGSRPAISPRSGTMPGMLGSRRVTRFSVALRDRGEKPAGIGMQGTVEEIEDIGLLDDLPGIHDVHGVAHLGDDAEVMGDHDDRGADPVAQLDHQPHDLGLGRHVQRGRGLVGDQQLRLADQAHGDHRPLPEPARQLVGKGVQPGLRFGNADQLEHLQHARADRRASRAPDGRAAARPPAPRPGAPG